MKKSFLFVVCCTLTLPASASTGWFSSSPLNSSYSALINKNYQLAWEELEINLSSQKIPEKYWVPIKNTILSSTDCGHKLKSFSIKEGNFTVKLINKDMPFHDGYRIIVSSDLLLKPARVVLTDPNDKSLIVGELVPNPSSISLISMDFHQAPKPGIYQLRINGNSHPLIIESFNEERWVTVQNGDLYSPLKVHIPKVPKSCEPQELLWEWSDVNYKTLGYRDMKIVRDGSSGQDYSRIPNKDFPDNTRYVSAVVRKVEFQAGIRVEYVNKVTVINPYYRYSSYFDIKER
ncbi:DUF2861 family protein [Vibrio sp. S4M6]|uniref:DUF2861 family protein n=1 Tax=Vibrio sinus TaxID=2946865 RepID=UPI00202A4E5D|nr:DUF2861 family protein [Vibrio sinus]MCL9781298.1 DUF2861 family protein [Vibrio sinus]